MNLQAKEEYEQLLRFIPFFESEEPKYTIAQEASFDPYHYVKEFNDFIMLASGTLTITGFDWHDFRKEYDESGQGDLAESISQMDLETIQKWMTTIIRSERYCSGTYAQMIDQGVFLAMLKQINKILRNHQ